MAGNDLDDLSSRELHDRAVRLAVHRLDLRFLWRLMRALPAAEAASGRLSEAETDVTRVAGELSDLIGARGGYLADELRPFYLEYLREHGQGERGPEPD
ncbi:MAG: hypothetical protein GEV11_29630 [Streptosporangiales bacterium]|nr:hypothetical protein [Streptosporangiales bacterium]